MKFYSRHLQAEQGQALIVLKRGDKLVEKLGQTFKELGIQGGAISGLGALTDVELGYYDLESKTYIRRLFNEDDYELLHLTGNYSMKDESPYIHVHAVLGKRDFSTFGGHLFEATVAVTAEITVFPLGKMPYREMDSLVGLSTICGIGG